MSALQAPAAGRRAGTPAGPLAPEPGVGVGAPPGSPASGAASTADRGCTILHVDMDAFYAAASLIDRPELVGRPVVIGGGMRSVVLSATYEARAYGIRSGIPMARARRLCPHAEIVRPDYERYSAISAAVMAVFSEVTHQVEPVSMEEAFLDVSMAQRRLGSPAQIGQWIRDTIADEQQITCSVGGAATKVVAKMASRAAKPDGMLMVPPEQVVSFLHPLPVSALWGVGESTETALHRLGLRTVADIAYLPYATLSRAMGANSAAHLHALAWGRDTGDVATARLERSVGSSETFHHDVDDPAVIRRQLLRLSDRSTSRMRHSGLLARTVVLTVRFSDFTTITRSRTMRESTDVTRDIFATATSLYAALGLQRARIRLLGVRLEGLTEAAQTPVQGRLDEPERGWRDAERAVDRATERFGRGIVQPASLVLQDAARGADRPKETFLTPRASSR